MEQRSELLNIDIVGYIPYEENQFTLPGMKTVGIGDKVYLANHSIMTKFAGSYELGQESESRMEAFAKVDYNGFAHDLKLQPKTIFNHHLMTIGTTNSGKSTSALAILDKAIQAGIKVLIIDLVNIQKHLVTLKWINVRWARMLSFRRLLLRNHSGLNCSGQMIMHNQLYCIKQSSRYGI